MNQQKLWHEDIYEALGTDVQALGGNKVVGAKLWPEKSPDKAGEHLSNCLNRTRNEKLNPEQVIFIITEARKITSLASMTFISKTSNFKDPEPIEPESENARLQREFIQAAKVVEGIAKQIEYIQQLKVAS